MARMRSSSGGCVASTPMKRFADAVAKKHMPGIGRVCAIHSREPISQPPIFCSAPERPAGLRVNCTDEASARNSRWRLTAAWIKRPKKTPMLADDQQRNSDESAADFCRGCAAAARMQQNPPDVARQRIPKIIPMSRMLSLMSPLRMWLNSWPMTPCNSSRDKISMQPRVTRDGRVAGRVAGGEGVDAFLVVEHIDLRHGHAGRDGHFLDDIEQFAFVRVGRVRVDEPCRPSISATALPPAASDMIL